MHWRKNILNLSARELNLVRQGFEGLQAFPFDDKRGYLFWAGLHGYPDFECPHHLPDFLTWHRAYVRALELAMQDVLGNYDIGLPYWDWTNPATVASGIPAVFTAKTYASGRTSKRNPLFDARILFPPNVDQRTVRNGGTNQSVLRTAQQQATAAAAQRSYLGFQRTLESAHDGLHGWVGGSGGTMSQINVAAFDPIFWFHHVNVDRLWAVWQRNNPAVPVPANVLSSSLAGLSLNGRDVIDHRAFGYDYAATSSTEAVRADQDALQGSDEPLRKRFTLTTTEFTTAELSFAETESPRETLAVRVFLDDSATASTTTDDPSYAGTRFIFGHGECMGADEGHCDWRKPRPVLDPRGQHHLTPWEFRLDVTDALQRRPAGRKRVDVSVVIVNMDGDPVPTDQLRFAELTLTVRD